MEALENNNIEIWKDVVDYEGLYKISNFGQVKSCDRIYVYPNGKKKKYKGKIKKICETGKRKNSNQGYLCTRLTNQNNKDKCELIHVLVARAFIQNPENKPTVNHKDGNKHNNNLENLEWATYSENNKHAYDNNLKSDNKILIRLKDDKINNIYISVSDAERKTGIRRKTIRDFINQKREDYYGYKWIYFEEDKYGVIYDDADGIRTGGFGSTDKK
jgi:hypothetical protein